MNFMLAVQDDIKGTWIVAHKKLACRYLTGWFIIDFVSVIAGS